MEIKTVKTAIIKRAFTGLLAGLLTLSNLAFLSGCSQSTTTTATEIVAAENQELLTGIITDIKGNEMRLMLVDEALLQNQQQMRAGKRPNSTLPDGEMPTDISAESSRPVGNFDTQNLTIPVGTVVTTAKGTRTTFSRLAAGDQVKVLLETNDSGEQVVVGIWIMDTSTQSSGETGETSNA